MSRGGDKAPQTEHFGHLRLTDIFSRDFTHKRVVQTSVCMTEIAYPTMHAVSVLIFHNLPSFVQI